MAFTQSDLTALDAAIKSGVSEVRFQDRTVRYNSLKDLLQARTLLVNELSTPGVAPAMIRHVRLYTDRGF